MRTNSLTMARLVIRRENLLKKPSPHPILHHPGLTLFLVNRQIYSEASRIFYTKTTFELLGTEESAAQLAFVLFLLDCPPAALRLIRSLSIVQKGHHGPFKERHPTTYNTGYTTAGYDWEVAPVLLQTLLPTMVDLRELRLSIHFSWDGKHWTKEDYANDEIYLCAEAHHLPNTVMREVKSIQTLTIWIEEVINNADRDVTVRALRLIQILRTRLLVDGARCGQHQVLSGDLPTSYKETIALNNRADPDDFKYDGTLSPERMERVQIYASVDSSEGKTFIKQNEAGAWKAPGFEYWTGNWKNVL